MYSNHRNSATHLWRLLVMVALLLVPLSLEATPALAAPSCSTSGTTVTCTFNYSGATETWIVPAGVTSLTVDVYGGSGGKSIFGSAPGGSGAHLKATLPVSWGDVLELAVG